MSIIDSDHIPRTGIGVMIFKDGKILLGKRKGAHGAGEYAFPGGHLEYMETFAECARRETREECGVEITNIRFEYTTASMQYAPKHYVHIGLIADWASGEPKALESDRCESWDWYPMDALPKSLFSFCQMAVDLYGKGVVCIDADGMELQPVTNGPSEHERLIAESR